MKNKSDFCGCDDEPLLHFEVFAEVAARVEAGHVVVVEVLGFVLEVVDGDPDFDLLCLFDALDELLVDCLERDEIMEN